MKTTARFFQGGRESDWLGELERLADQIEGASPDARPALRATVAAFLDEDPFAQGGPEPSRRGRKAGRRRAGD